MKGLDMLIVVISEVIFSVDNYIVLKVYLQNLIMYNLMDNKLYIQDSNLFLIVLTNILDILDRL